MPSYIEKSLGAGESVVHTARTSKWVHSGSIVASLVLLTCAIALLVYQPHAWYWTLPLAGAALLAVRVYWSLASTELVVTTQRVVTVYGIFNRRTTEIKISKIEGIRVEQSLLGRMLNFGTIIVTGIGTTYEPVVGIRDPLAFHAAVMQTGS